MKFFTSDLHFNHVNILKYQADTRPYKNIDDMNETIISTINSLCSPQDELYILGDVLMGARNKGMHLVERLNPRLHLVRGNHDTFSKEQEERLFESANDYLVVRYEKSSIVCFHYPIERWDKCHYGIMHLHGHSHGSMKNKLPNRYDIGWDVFPFPLSIEEILSWKEEEKVPHH